MATVALALKIEITKQTMRALNRVCGPRTGTTRQDWVAAAIAEKLERETANTSVKVE